MKSNLQLDFLVNKEKRTINVNREFDATLDLVWAAWTTSELLDQWWAPKPWKTETKSMDFKVGGFWIYAMVGPEGDKHFARADYIAIKEMESFSGLDGFCDSEGVINEALPQNKWDNNFSKKNELTMVNIQLSFKTLEDLEKIIEMGFKEGFLSALENLDELLAKK